MSSSTLSKQMSNKVKHPIRKHEYNLITHFSVERISSAMLKVSLTQRNYYLHYKRLPHQYNITVQYRLITNNAC